MRSLLASRFFILSLALLLCYTPTLAQDKKNTKRVDVHVNIPPELQPVYQLIQERFNAQSQDIPGLLSYLSRIPGGELANCVFNGVDKQRCVDQSFYGKYNAKRSDTIYHLASQHALDTLSGSRTSRRSGQIGERAHECRQARLIPNPTFNVACRNYCPKLVGLNPSCKCLFNCVPNKAIAYTARIPQYQISQITAGGADIDPAAFGRPDLLGPEVVKAGREVLQAVVLEQIRQKLGANISLGRTARTGDVTQMVREAQAIFNDMLAKNPDLANIGASQQITNGDKSIVNSLNTNPMGRIIRTAIASKAMNSPNARFGQLRWQGYQFGGHFDAHFGELEGDVILGSTESPPEIGPATFTRELAVPQLGNITLDHLRLPLIDDDNAFLDLPTPLTNLRALAAKTATWTLALRSRTCNGGLGVCPEPIRISDGIDPFALAVNPNAQRARIGGIVSGVDSKFPFVSFQKVIDGEVDIAIDENDSRLKNIDAEYPADRNAKASNRCYDSAVIPKFGSDNDDIFLTQLPVGVNRDYKTVAWREMVFCSCEWCGPAGGTIRMDDKYSDTAISYGGPLIDRNHELFRASDQKWISYASEAGP